jgi:hypothetical protein
VRLLDQGDGNHGIGQTWPEDGYKRQSQKQARKSQNNIHEPHDERVYGATDEAGEKPDQDAHHQGQRNDDAADEEGIAGAVEETRQQIAPDGIGTKKKPRASAFLPNRRLKKGIAKLLGWTIRSNNIGKDCQEASERKNHKTGDGAAIFAKVAPELQKECQPAAAPVVDHRMVYGFSRHLACRIRGLMTP